MNEIIRFYQDSPIDFGLDLWNIRNEAANRHNAVFMKCRCNSVNPLGILRASDDRFWQAVSDPLVWINDDWQPIGENFMAHIRTNYQIEYVKMLDNRDDRLMVFCFSPAIPNNNWF